MITKENIGAVVFKHFPQLISKQIHGGQKGACID